MISSTVYKECSVKVHYKVEAVWFAGTLYVGEHTWDTHTHTKYKLDQEKRIHHGNGIPEVPSILEEHGVLWLSDSS